MKTRLLLKQLCADMGVFKMTLIACGLVAFLSACSASDATAKAEASSAASSCKDLNANTLIGFDEIEKTPQCRPLKNYSLVGFKCEVEKNAFGAELDAVHIETQTQNIFAYQNASDCQQALETREGNGP